MELARFKHRGHADAASRPRRVGLVEKRLYDVRGQQATISVMDASYPQIAVVLPCYRSKEYVLDVIGRIGPQVFFIVAVDDACPDGTGDHIKACCADPRVKVVRN